MRGQPKTNLVQLQEYSYSWLVVRTKPRQEKIAMHHLAQRQVRPYCPMFKRPPWHLRAPRGPVPLFAGYIFVHCDPEVQLNAVRYCPGILAPVSFNGAPACVSQEMIDAIKMREGERGYVLPNEEAHGIPVGSTVRVMTGSLEGIKGVFQGYLRGGERAKVLMDFLRAQHEVEVDAAALAMLRA